MSCVSFSYDAVSKGQSVKHGDLETVEEGLDVVRVLDRRTAPRYRSAASSVGVCVSVWVRLECTRGLSRRSVCG